MLTLQMRARRKAQSGGSSPALSRPTVAQQVSPADEIGRSAISQESRPKPGKTLPSQSSAVANPLNRNRRPRSPELWRRVEIAPEHDIRLLRPPSLPRGERFETAEDVAEYDAARIASLMNARPDLAAEIERREEGVVIPSTPISARDCRDFRVPDIADRLRIAEEREGPHKIATIYLGAFPAGRLHSFDLERAHWSLTKHLDRAGFKGALLTGGTEVAWIDRHGVWKPHCHLLSIGVPDVAWDRLRELLPDASPAVALKVQALTDLPDQLSYCQKFNPTHMPGKRGPVDRAPAYQLPPKRLVEWAVWMVKYRLEDFGFHYHCRRRGGHIVPDA